MQRYNCYRLVIFIYESNFGMKRNVIELKELYVKQFYPWLDQGIYTIHQFYEMIKTNSMRELIRPYLDIENSVEVCVELDHTDQYRFDSCTEIHKRLGMHYSKEDHALDRRRREQWKQHATISEPNKGN